MKIILASSSPRRKELLSTIVPYYDMIPSTVNEDSIKEHEKDPENLVKRLSMAKAYQVFHDVYNKEIDQEYTVIGSDTIVSLQGRILGKPKNEQDAINMLHLLQGRSNDVYTGTTVIIRKPKTIVYETRVNKSTVYFNYMSHSDILNYVATKEPLDKAGAYAVQGIGKKYLKGFEGDYNSIIGLDTRAIKKILERYHLLAKYIVS